MSKKTELRKLVKELKKRGVDLQKVSSEAMEIAMQKAVKTAANATPPKRGEGRVRGVNTVTGELKRSWAESSKTKPTKEGGKLVAELRNNVEYASYVNDGHRMDKHFVPGLYIDSNGLLSRDTNPATKQGLVVGTKTKYVKGLYMTDKAKEAYEKELPKQLKKKIKEAVNGGGNS